MFNRKKSMKHFRLLSASTLVLAAVSSPAMAQDNSQGDRLDEPQGNRLDEIVVTATKRATGLQDTPVAITAVSAEKLERRNVDNISEVASFAPNLTFDTTAPVSGLSNGAVVFIRGVGQTDFQLTTDPGVGTYIDGVYASRSAGGVLDVLDLERVEVLRGPQGTLFGRNAIGGAINMVSKRPSDEFGGKASVTFGSRDRIDLSGSLNIPITDTLRTRISVSSKNQDGYMIGLLDDRDLGNVNRDSIRFVAEWAPSDDFTATLAFDGSRTGENMAPSKLLGVTFVAPGSAVAIESSFNRDTGGVDVVNRPQVPGNPSLVFLQNVIDSTLPGPLNGVIYNGDFITPDLDTTFATGPQGTDLESLGGALTLEWRTQFATIKSITALRTTDGTFNRDADGSPIALTHNSNKDYFHRQFSQELQLTGETDNDRFKWAVGLYYFDERGRDILDVTLPQGFGLVRNFTFVDNESLAGYFQGSYNLTDAFSVTGGIRYTRDTKTYTVPAGGGAIENGFAGIFGPPGTSTDFFPPGENRERFVDVSYKVGAEYKFGDGTLAYGSFSTGFKSGGFNTRYLVVVPTAVSFDPETLESFELGLKWQGLNNRVRANLAAFSSKYDDVQLIVYENGAPLTRNAGSADIKGVEAEITAVIGDNLDLSMALGYTDAEYSSVRDLDPALPAFQQVQLSSKLPNTPEFTFSMAADYTIELQNGDILLHADWAHSSSIENDAINSPFLSEGKTDVFNASLGYKHDGRWGITVFVDNLTDERFIVSGDSNYGIGFHEATFNRPREWGLRLSTEF